MNSAIPANSALTSPGMSVSARHLCAAASCVPASFSVQVLPPAASTSPAASSRSSSLSGSSRASRAASSRRLGGAGRQGGHHRQRLLPGPQVRPHRLAGHLGGSPDAEQVVGELEGQARVRAERGQSHRQLGRGPDVDGADAARARHQRGGLVPGHRQALRQRDVVALLEREVRALARDQPLHRGGQGPGRPHPLRGGCPPAGCPGRARAWRHRPGWPRRSRTRSRRSAGACARCRRP